MFLLEGIFLKCLGVSLSFAPERVLSRRPAHRAGFLAAKSVNPKINMVNLCSSVTVHVLYTR